MITEERMILMSELAGMMVLNALDHVLLYLSFPNALQTSQLFRVPHCSCQSLRENWRVSTS